MPKEENIYKTLSLQVYKKIKDKLLYLEILPGTTLQEREVANMFSVSRTPIREAFQRLAIEGWIEIKFRKRVVVREIYERDVREVFQLRRIIEPMVVEIILEERLADKALIDKIQKILNKMKFAKEDNIKFINLDQSFHALIISKINNDRLNQMWKKISDEIIRYGMIAMQKPGRFVKVIKEHQEIIDALFNMKKRNARRRCLEHLYSTENIILESIFKEGGKEVY